MNLIYSLPVVYEYSTTKQPAYPPPPSTTSTRTAHLERAGTSDDVDELVRDGGLATTVVLHLERADHVRRVLRRVVHGVATAKVDENVYQLVGTSGLTER